MKEINEFLKKHKVSMVRWSIGVYVAILLLTQVPYWLGNMMPFSIKTDITADAMLGFWGSFIGAIATILLGVISIYQNYKLNEINEAQAKENKNLEEKMLNLNKEMLNLEERNNKLIYGSYIDIKGCFVSRTKHTNSHLLENKIKHETGSNYINLYLENHTKSNPLRILDIQIYDDNGCPVWRFEGEVYEDYEEISIVLPDEVFEKMFNGNLTKKLNMAFVSCWTVRMTGVCWLKKKEPSYSGDKDRELIKSKYIFNGIDFTNKNII